MLKGLGNIASLLKQAQQMQGRLTEVQEELGRLRVQGGAGGGMVTVEADGRQRVISCQIDKSLLKSGDQEMIEDLLVAAVNQALEKSRETAAQEMSKLAGDVNIPGLGDALAKFGLGGGSSD